MAADIRHINGEAVIAHSSGAAYLPDHAALIVADLHFEKGSAYAEGGQLIPPYDTRTTLKRLGAVIDEVEPECVIALGDSFHDLRADDRMAQSDAAALMSLVGQVKNWVWVEGNHDPEPPARFGGECLPEMRLGHLTLRHEPQMLTQPGEVAGHLHPATRVKGRGRRLKCFATDGQRLILPAFGAYAGGLALSDPAFLELFGRKPDAWVIGEKAVYAIPARKLAG